MENIIIAKELLHLAKEIVGVGSPKDKENLLKKQLNQQGKQNGENSNETKDEVEQEYENNANALKEMLLNPLEYNKEKHRFVDYSDHFRDFTVFMEFKIIDPLFYMSPEELNEFVKDFPNIEEELKKSSIIFMEGYKSYTADSKPAEIKRLFKEFVESHQMYICYRSVDRQNCILKIGIKTKALTDKDKKEKNEFEAFLKKWKAVM